MDKFAVCYEIFDLFLKLTFSFFLSNYKCIYIYYFFFLKKKVNSSIFSYFSPPLAIWYGATKSALNKFTHDLYYVASKYNVRVNLLVPGSISTNMIGNDPSSIPPTYLAKILKKQLEDNVFCISYPFYQNLYYYILSTLPKRVSLLVSSTFAKMIMKSHDLN